MAGVFDGCTNQHLVLYNLDEHQSILITSLPSPGKVMPIVFLVSLCDTSNELSHISCIRQLNLEMSTCGV